MSVYSIEGKLGTGKTKFAVWRAQQALLEGRRVASNVDLRQHVLVSHRRTLWVRLPDKPLASDLEAAGHGNPDSYDEERNGVMILDELGTWLNSRSFQDKERAPLIDWLIHARKHGWDVYLIVQDANMIDRQVREALIEYQCRCVRLDKIRIPLVGKLLGVFGGRVGYLPRMHLVSARVGYGANAIVAERWVYRGDDLHAAYDTRQVFRSDYAHGTHSVLPPHGWEPVVPPLAKFVRSARTWLKGRPPAVRPPVRPKLAVVRSIADKLPPDERMRHARRLERLGLLRRA